jgi:hypothetical protein
MKSPVKLSSSFRVRFILFPPWVVYLLQVIRAAAVALVSPFMRRHQTTSTNTIPDQLQQRGTYLTTSEAMADFCQRRSLGSALLSRPPPAAFDRPRIALEHKHPLNLRWVLPAQAREQESLTMLRFLLWPGLAVLPRCRVGKAPTTLRP